MSVRAKSVIVAAVSASADAELPREERTGGRPPLLETWMDPLDWLTRGAVARALNCHVSTVRRLEAHGVLKPRIGDGGLRYFSYRAVKDLKESRAKKKLSHAAETRLAAFELFRQGVDWRDVAIELRCDPLRVHQLWQLYSERGSQRSEDEDNLLGSQTTSRVR